MIILNLSVLGNDYSQTECLRQAQLTLLTEKRAAFCHLDLVQVAMSRRTKKYETGLDKACAVHCAGLLGAAGEPVGRWLVFKEGEEPQPGVGRLLLHHRPLPKISGVETCALP